MTSDGKQLEALVAFVEETLVPQGFSVKIGEKRFDEDGTPLAEFDVEVRGKVGSTEMVWLIECRDRPSKGPAPSEWIQSLDGRRRLFGFNKVTAVSTTGFSKGALAAARKLDIELRTVKSLSADAFGDWLPLKHFEAINNQCEMTGCRLLIDKNSSPEIQAVMREVIATMKADDAVLKKSGTGERAKPAEALLALVEQNNLFDGLEPNGPDRRIQVKATYVNDADHFVVETDLGDVRIRAIEFTGLLRAKEMVVPISMKAEYTGAGDSGVISQFAAFDPIEVQGTSLAMEIHRIPESGTHFTFRKVGKG